MTERQSITSYIQQQSDKLREYAATKMDEHAMEQAVRMSALAADIESGLDQE